MGDDKELECPHCHGNVWIRQPTTICDHLYYPELCQHCTEMGYTISGIRWGKDGKAS